MGGVEVFSVLGMDESKEKGSKGLVKESGGGFERFWELLQDLEKGKNA